MFTEELTQRENDVARLLAKGLNNEEIGKRLLMSEPTVKTHLTNIYQKYGLSSDKNKKSSAQRVRACLIYLGLASRDTWNK